MYKIEVKFWLKTKTSNLTSSFNLQSDHCLICIQTIMLYFVLITLKNLYSPDHRSDIICLLFDTVCESVLYFWLLTVTVRNFILRMMAESFRDKNHTFDKFGNQGKFLAWCFYFGNLTCYLMALLQLYAISLF